LDNWIRVGEFLVDPGMMSAGSSLFSSTELLALALLLDAIQPDDGALATAFGMGV